MDEAEVVERVACVALVAHDRPAEIAQPGEVALTLPPIYEMPCTHLMGVLTELETKGGVMGVARKALITASLSACRQRLEALGVTRHGAHRAEIFTLPLAPRVLGWIGLARSVYRGDGSMAISANAGLLHQDVEQLVASCAGLPYHRYYPPTVLTGIGMLTPTLTAGEVSFYPGASIDVAADQVIQPLQEYGLPWMRDHASLAGIQALDGDVRYRITLDTWRQAVIAYLLDQPERARQYLSSTFELIALEGNPDPQDAWQRFAVALEEQMARGPWRP